MQKKHFWRQQNLAAVLQLSYRELFIFLNIPEKILTPSSRKKIEFKKTFNLKKNYFIKMANFLVYVSSKKIYEQKGFILQIIIIMILIILIIMMIYFSVLCICLWFYWSSNLSNVKFKKIPLFMEIFVEIKLINVM